MTYDFERTEERKVKLRMVKLALLTALVVLAAVTLIALIASEFYKIANGDGTMPEDERMFTLNGADEAEMRREYGSYINFERVAVSKSIKGEAGHFICFYGTIYAEDFSFDTRDATKFGLDLYLSDWESTKRTTKFEPALSRTLSETELLLDGEEGKMDGSFALVFEIDAECFELIKSKSGEGPDGFWQIELFPNYYPKGIKLWYGFKTSECEYIETIS